METVGIVLAGGQSRRFGSPKAFVSYANRCFYEYAVEALSPHCDEVVLSTQEQWVTSFPKEYRVVIDDPSVKGDGPLAGILSVMQTVKARRYMVLPCDMPFVTADLMGELLRQHRSPMTAVTTDHQRHPLLSIWYAELKEVIDLALQQGRRSVLDALENTPVHWIEGNQLTERPAYHLLNVNSREQWEGREL